MYMYMYIHVLYVRQQTGEEQRGSQVDHVAIRDYVQMALECPYTCNVANRMSQASHILVQVEMCVHTCT